MIKVIASQSGLLPEHAPPSGARKLLSALAVSGGVCAIFTSAIVVAQATRSAVQPQDGATLVTKIALQTVAKGTVQKVAPAQPVAVQQPGGNVAAAKKAQRESGKSRTDDPAIESPGASGRAGRAHPRPQSLPLEHRRAPSDQS